MKLGKLKTDFLKKALASLERAISQPLDEFSRDSVIQRFEFTFESSLEADAESPGQNRPLEDASIKGILREAARLGLIQDLDAWFKFHESRNLTSHTYNEKTAEEVHAVAVLFPAHVKHLVSQVDLRIAAPAS